MCPSLQAGIASEECPTQLLIALEPEAASVCCRKLRMHQMVPDPRSSPLPLMVPRRATSQPKNLDHALPDIKEGGYRLNLHDMVYQCMLLNFDMSSSIILK